jgi:hypothetical protein
MSAFWSLARLAEDAALHDCPAMWQDVHTCSRHVKGDVVLQQSASVVHFMPTSQHFVCGSGQKPFSPSSADAGTATVGLGG